MKTLKVIFYFVSLIPFVYIIYVFIIYLCTSKWQCLLLPSFVLNDATATQRVMAKIFNILIVLQLSLRKFSENQKRETSRLLCDHTDRFRTALTIKCMNYWLTNQLIIRESLLIWQHQNQERILSCQNICLAVNCQLIHACLLFRKLAWCCWSWSFTKIIQVSLFRKISLVSLGNKLSPKNNPSCIAGVFEQANFNTFVCKIRSIINKWRLMYALLHFSLPVRSVRRRLLNSYHTHRK